MMTQLQWANKQQVLYQRNQQYKIVEGAEVEEAELKAQFLPLMSPKEKNSAQSLPKRVQARALNNLNLLAAHSDLGVNPVQNSLIKVEGAQLTDNIEMTLHYLEEKKSLVDSRQSQYERMMSSTRLTSTEVGPRHLACTIHKSDVSRKILKSSRVVKSLAQARMMTAVTLRISMRVTGTLKYLQLQAQRRHKNNLVFSDGMKGVIAS